MKNTDYRPFHIIILESRIARYHKIKDPEKRMHHWYMITGFLEALHLTEQISLQEFKFYSDQI